VLREILYLCENI